MSGSHASRRRRALVAASVMFPAPALATTYDLSNQPLNVATAPYTSADILNCSNVTFSSTPAGGSLLAGVNLVTSDTINTGNGLTLAGALSGSATLFKSGTGPLTLAALSPSFTGPLTLNASGGTLRLGVESPLAGTGGSLTLGTSTTLDLNGFNSPGRTITYSGGNSILNNNTTATSSFSSLPANTTLALGGAGTLNLTAGLQNNANYTKTGTGTLVLSAGSPSFNGTLTVSAGIVALGVAAPFAGALTPSIYLPNAGTALDLNGLTAGTVSITLASGAALVNNNLATPVTLSSLASVTASGGLTLGGAGDINLTAKAPSFTKTGTGMVTLSTANPLFSGALTIYAGTVRVTNAAALGTSSSPSFNLGTNGVTSSGYLDLNGFAAPAGDYYFNAGALINDNSTATSTIAGAVSFGAAYNSAPAFGGNGNLLAQIALPSNLDKFGNGTLTLTQSQSFSNAFVVGGALRLSPTASYSGNLTISGSSSINAFHYAALDLNGRSSTSLFLTLYNNAGIVNNDTANPVTLDNNLTVAYPNVFPAIVAITLGGDGTVNVAANNNLGTKTINKVGAGLLTLPSSFSPTSVNLRAGTLQVESGNQLGSTVSFLGGTLRVAPLYLAPQSSYTFPAAIAVDPAGGTIDTQRDTTLTGAFSGTGSLAKAGTATLTLSKSPSASVDLSVAAGTLRFAPILAAATIGSLAVTPGATVDLRNTSLTTTADYALLRQYLHDGLLTSSSADATHVLGCKDTNPGTYHVQLTVRGDANLDGAINADDFALVDRAFAQSSTNAHWTDGDFNYDGVIDQNDYLAIDTAYLQQQGGSPSPDFLAARQSQFGDAYVSDLLATVPEPSVLGLFIAAPLVGRRRRA